MFERKVEHLITCDRDGCAEQLAPTSEQSLLAVAEHLLTTETMYAANVELVATEVFKGFAKASGWRHLVVADRTMPWAWMCPKCAATVDARKVG